MTPMEMRRLPAWRRHGLLAFVCACLLLVAFLVTSRSLSAGGKGLQMHLDSSHAHSRELILVQAVFRCAHWQLHIIFPQLLLLEAARCLLAHYLVIVRDWGS